MWIFQVVSTSFNLFFVQIQQPSQKELELAEKVQESLADMTGSVKPSDVVNVAAIRKAMGISAGAVRVAAN